MTRLFIEPRPCPNRSPGIFCSVAQKVGIEVCLVSFSARDIFLAQDRFSYRHALFKLIFRQCAPPERISSFARPLVQAVRCSTDARRFQSKKTPLPESKAPALGQAWAA